MGCVISGSIVTYNNMKSIKKTLETLFEHTKDSNFKLYVVDNGSTDGTPEFIEKEYPQVELIRTGKNIGFGAGHNVVIEKIQSDYHAIINPDLVFPENTIGKMAEFMENNRDVGLVSPKICFPDGRNQILGKKNPCLKYLVASRLRKGDEPGKLLSEYAMLEKGTSEPFDIENASGCLMLVRTVVLKQINGFDERYFMYFEDADLTRMVNEISRSVYYPDAVIHHVWGRDSKRNVKLMAIHFQSMLKYFAKWKTL